MLVSVFADEVEKLLKLRHLDNPVTAERVQPVFGEPAFANIRGHVAIQIIGRDPAISEWSGADPAHNRAISIFLSDSAGDNFLVIHLLFGKKIFGQVRTMKDDPFVWFTIE